MNIRSKPRSFVLRRGRVTSAQQDALTTLRSKFILEDTCKKLDFEVLFDNTNPTVVDIGFGSGETLLYLANNNPHKNFLGIEVYLSGIGSSLRKAGLQELTNLRIINKLKINSYNEFQHKSYYPNFKKNINAMHHITQNKTKYAIDVRYKSALTNFIPE